MILTLKRLADGVIVTALVALGLAPLIPVFTLPAIVVPALGGLLLGALVASFASWRRLTPLLTLATAAGAYLVFAPAMAVPEYAAAGLFPSLRAEQWLVTGATTVWRRLLTVDTPVGLGGGFGLAPFLLAYVGAVAAASLAVRLGRRWAPAAALAPMTVTALSVVLGTSQTVAVLPLGLVGGLGALAWAAWRAKTLQPRRVLALVVTVAVAVGVGFAGGEAAERRERLVVRDKVQAPFDPRDYPSPLAAYRRYLKEGLEGKVLLEVANLPEGGVVKLAVMDRFDGIVWNVAGGGTGEASGNFGRMAAAGTGAGAAPIRLEDHDTDNVWLYSVGLPRSVEFSGADSADLRERLRFNPVTGTMALPPAPPDGLVYEVWADVGLYRPGADVIAQAGAADVAQPSYVKVQSADMKAAAAVRDAATGGAQALALEQYLQDGYYSDGQEGATEGSNKSEALAGHGADRVAALLDADQMVGNAEQYASAMALMARSVGLSARVVMGFAPGYGEQPAPNSTHQGPQGSGAKAGAYKFAGLDMTAWVEVHLQGLGWVPFFPTPNRQDSPEEAEEKQDPKPQPEVVQPPPPDAKPSEPPDEEMAPVPVGSAKPVAKPAPVFRWGAVSIGAAAAVGLVLLAAALAGTVVLAKARRRKRRRSQGPPSHRIVAGWEEMVDQLRDMGLAPAPEELAAATRREAAVQAPAAAVAQLTRLAAESDAAAFGSLALGEPYAARYWEGVDQAERSLMAGLGRWARLRAHLSAASLRARRRARR
ncbi:MAG: transglutaminase-like domain-containing protein [Bifidobacteriaceae bacterium]|jgi:hypothetical protein|nr:transglutaminase-like domain-containing protein [Bifidobacteriaceae bacterium]